MTTHYRLDPTGLQATYEWFASFEDVWQQRFDALDALVSSDQPDQQASTAPALKTDDDRESS